MARAREFDWKPGLFKDVVLYIAGELADDPTFGSTKLNKILYFSDTDAYRELGEPITGALYQRNHFGPTAVEYEPMIGEMEAQELVTVKHENVVDHPQDVVTPTGKFLLEIEQHTTAEQRRILDARIAEFRGYTNTESSDESHRKSAGWLTRELFETIPYASSIINPEPFDAHVLAGLKTKATA